MGGAAAWGPSHRKPAIKLKPPSKFLMLSEWRAALEFTLGIATIPGLLTAKRGDGHPVLVLPGFLASDLSTDFLRRYLQLLGYDVYAWELGRNLGGIYSMRRKLQHRLAEINLATGRKVTIVGWSLGGLYARDLALTMPESVRTVITMGSPFSRDVTATNAGGLYHLLSGESIAAVPPADLEWIAGELPMPVTSIYTKTDGIVNYHTCLLEEGKTAENIEVYASHIGLGVNPSVLWAVADRLAQPEGSFEPFVPHGPLALAYPAHDAAA